MKEDIEDLCSKVAELIIEKWMTHSPELVKPRRARNECVAEDFELYLGGKAEEAACWLCGDVYARTR